MYVEIGVEPQIERARDKRVKELEEKLLRLGRILPVNKYHDTLSLVMQLLDPHEDEQKDRDRAVKEFEEELLHLRRVLPVNKYNDVLSMVMQVLDSHEDEQKDEDEILRSEPTA